MWMEIIATQPTKVGMEQDRHKADLQTRDTNRTMNSQTVWNVEA